MEHAAERASESENNENAFNAPRDLSDAPKLPGSSRNGSQKGSDKDKNKARKLVHNLLYFIEAVNNRAIISQLRARPTQEQATGSQGEGGLWHPDRPADP